MSLVKRLEESAKRGYEYVQITQEELFEWLPHIYEDLKLHMPEVYKSIEPISDLGLDGKMLLCPVCNEKNIICIQTIQYEYDDYDMMLDMACVVKGILGFVSVCKKTHIFLMSYSGNR